MSDEELTGFMEQAIRGATKAQLIEIITVMVDRTRKARAAKAEAGDELLAAAKPFLGNGYQGTLGSTNYKNQVALDMAVRLYERAK
jgi:hypothetical protein